MNRCGLTGIIGLFYSSGGFRSLSSGGILRSPAARGSGARSCRAADSEVEFGKAALENLFCLFAEARYFAVGEVMTHGSDNLLEGERVDFASGHGVDDVGNDSTISAVRHATRVFFLCGFHNESVCFVFPVQR
jgi:hypothetical protein